MKQNILIIMLLIFISLQAVIVAKVGDEPIYLKELLAEIEKFEDDYTYGQIREMALQKLINKKVIILHANNNNITVNETELQTFSIRQLGTHPRFQTDGEFDYSKYELFKSSQKGAAILAEMKEELLLNKAKTLISESFNISSRNVFDEYYSRNTELDIGYALIDINDASVSADISLEKANEYYQKTKTKYEKIKKVKLELLLVFDEEFADTIQIIVKEKLKYVLEADSTLNSDDLELIKTQFQKEKSSEMCRKKIEYLKDIWQKENLNDYSIIETAYLSENDFLGKLPSEIIKSSLQMKKGDYSEPISIENGYLVFKIADKKMLSKTDTLAVARAVWHEYISNESTTKKEYADYFRRNIDEFIVPVAVVKKIEISAPPFFSLSDEKDYMKSIQDSIRNNVFDDLRLKKIVKKHNLKTYNSILFLEKFDNDTTIDNTIANLISTENYSGFLPSENKIIFFKIISYFPEYIPRLDKIQSQLYKFINIAKFDSTDYQCYYSKHKKLFSTPDSIKLAGAFFAFDEIEIDVSVDSIFKNNMLKYQQNIEKYYRENAIEFDYIFTENKEIAEMIEEQINSKIDFSLLDYCFGKKLNLAKNRIIEIEELPDTIRVTLNKLKIGNVAKPMKYKTGWLILKLKKIYPSGTVPYSEIKFELFQQKIQKIKREIASQKAKTVFDSTRYYSQLRNYVNENQLFQTAFQNANENFNIIGSIDGYRDDILRMWSGEKFSQIYENNDGFGLLFLRKIKKSKELDFQTALPQIKKAMNAKKRFEKAKKFITNIRANIIAGANPEDQLLFFGGWNKLENLKLDDKLSEIKYSDIILDDIIKREIGYYSPPFSIQQEQIFFYYVYNIDRPTEAEYREVKSTFHQQMIDEKFEKWLSQKKALLKIEKF